LQKLLLSIRTKLSLNNKTLLSLLPLPLCLGLGEKFLKQKKLEKDAKKEKNCQGRPD
jgi:hypothetical protein